MLLFTVQSLASIPRLQPLQKAKQEAEKLPRDEDEDDMGSGGGGIGDDVDDVEM